VPPSLADRLEHILDAIAGIQLLLRTMPPEVIESDRIRRLALEREFEIICEASRHVPPTVKARENSINWQRMIDLGNRLRHDHAYDRVRIDILLDIARDELPPLQAFVERIMAEESKR